MALGDALAMEAGWRTGEGGGAWATWCGTTDKWGRATTGPDGQRWGAEGREESEAARR
jgi:hypothetical protein